MKKRIYKPKPGHIKTGKKCTVCASDLTPPELIYGCYDCGKNARLNDLDLTVSDF